MILDVAKEAIALHLKTIYTKARVGVGGHSTSPFSSDLDVPIFNVTVSSSTSEGATIDFKFTINGASIAGHTIREIGIFNKAYSNSAGTTIAEYTEMLSRVSFDGIGPFASGEDVDFYITIEVE
tara:strand:- start:710 stop:1081 length:372 start_codon:yes stop_codon:yes gene_type:complete